MSSRSLVERIKWLLQDPVRFVEYGSRLKLRRYQEAVARAVIDSVRNNRGLSIVVMFPRQSGKNELQAQIEAYLLTVFSEANGEMVKVSPTWKPQSLNAMRRLERVLAGHVLTRPLWSKEQGYIFRIKSARIFFLSGSPEANIVGATASTLLEVDEAQDVSQAKFDKDIGPMAASTNATRVFWGTAWTSKTLLARELRAAREAERRDGIRRVFVLSAVDVAAEVPAYGAFVASQVEQLGRNHPMVKTQFFSEEIDAEGGMFPSWRVGMMRGEHQARQAPDTSCLYAVLVDVAGEDEGLSDASGELVNPGRDATALTVVEVEAGALPIYRVVHRRMWVGVKHARLYEEIRAIADHWRARYVVVDSTGVGAGLASFLSAALPERVIPFDFTAASKSKLGWDFLAAIDTGRWKDYASPEDDDLQREFYHQVEHCQYEIVPGPQKWMRWSVPDGTRDQGTGELVHDDLLISGALATVLDDRDFTVGGPAVIVRRADPLTELDREAF